MVAVRPSGRCEETFDLSIAGAHEFVANGIVVSNCSDAALYAFRHLTHYLSSGAVSRPAPGTREAYAAEAEQLERKMDALEKKREDRYEQMEADDENAAYHASTNDWSWQ